MRVGLYLDGPEAEFERAAMAWSQQSGAVCFPMRSLAGMIDRAAQAGGGTITHLAIFCHGTPAALGQPGRWGVDIRPARWVQPGFIGPEEFADAWGPKLAPHALVSLCACLCGRSQHWYLQQRFGKLVATFASPWGQESYENGGATSLAISLMRALGGEDRQVCVRAHCAAGHCTHQALLREFRPGLSLGLSLFRRVVGPTAEWSLKLRNEWQSVVKGQLAERWLLGDNTVEEEITDRMKEEG